jgi:hypothetical protein
MEKPVGLFACDDTRAIWALEACRHLGLPVPDQVAVTGADDDEVRCCLAFPTLSSVRVPARRVGYEAARLLDEAQQIAERGPMPLYLAEERTMEVNHCEVGRMIIKSWNLGAQMGDTIFFHHFLDSYPGTHRDYLLTVAAANYFANANNIGYSGDRYPEKLPDFVFTELGISWDDLEAIEALVTKEIDKAKIFLQVAE